jgi:hypothetical protein
MGYFKHTFILLDVLIQLEKSLGRLEENGPLATQLQEVNVPLVAREVCEKEYPHSVTDRMICTGFKKGGRDPCNVRRLVKFRAVEI